MGCKTEAHAGEWLVDLDAARLGLPSPQRPRQPLDHRSPQRIVRAVAPANACAFSGVMAVIAAEIASCISRITARTLLRDASNLTALEAAWT